MTPDHLVVAREALQAGVMELPECKAARLITAALVALEAAEAARAKQDADAPLTVRIDRIEYAVPNRVMTGREIRNLPPIPDRYDLYLVGDDEDVFVPDGMLIPYIVGRWFFTVPSEITASSEAEAARHERDTKIREHITAAIDQCEGETYGVTDYQMQHLEAILAVLDPQEDTPTERAP